MRIKKFLALLLCAVLLAGLTAPVAVAAPETPAEKAVDGLFKNIGLLTLRVEPWKGYIYNFKYAPQWVFGFNGVYDAFTFLSLSLLDTLHVKFPYGGRDWLIQLWKGAYGGAVAIGGEMGVYSKSPGLPVGHYASALPKDWLGMEMSIYVGACQLFTRPFERTWWCTGYQIGRLDGVWSSPRENLTMVSRVQLKDAPMAALFGEVLASKGFARVKQPPAADAPETYFIDGDTVYFSWRSVTESCL